MHWGLVIFGIVAVLFLFVVYRIAIRNWAVVHFQRLNQRIHEAFDGSCPPMRIKLTPLEDGQFQWSNPRAVKQATRLLLSLGFEPIGNYRVHRNAYMQIRAFCHPDQSAQAIYFDLNGYKSGLAFISDYNDETTWTYSSRPNPKTPKPPWEVLEHHPGSDIPTLWERFLAERPNRNLCLVSPEKFVERFEKSYARHMDWVAERGGYTGEEFREAIVALNGQYTSPILNRLRITKEQVTDEMITKAQQDWRELFRKHFENQIRQAEEG